MVDKGLDEVVLINEIIDLLRSRTTPATGFGIIVLVEAIMRKALVEWLTDKNRINWLKDKEKVKCEH